ncbi:MAG: glycoside hydrolase family 31 protein [Saprospiraceae bacterium]|mgnify:CR=1 FL=1|nr:glycoside hydrolase family 31 protein [Saprospiraceae bacterium]HPK09021.1 glycoside hydrolase family 31 protein [Saprospiraceae bacterium]
MENKSIVHYNEKEYHPELISQYTVASPYFEFTDNVHCTLRIDFVSEEIVRVRYGVHHIFKRDFSYAIDQSHPFIRPEIQFSNDSKYYYLKTIALTIKIEKQGMKVSIFDSSGFLLNSDEKGFHWEHNPNHGGNIVKVSKHCNDDEAFYGLGDKPAKLNLRGDRYQNWGTDNYGYTEGSDPLYKNIPFFYGLRNGVAYGIFYDNSYDSYFDFGCERPDVFSYWSMGGEMNYYFIAGPQLMDVAKRYCKLTGTPEMPPLWSLGFQQCKWSYYPESKVMEVADKMREYKIPCDAIYLDIDYMDGFRCFTWDLEKFPNPKKMVATLKENGFKTMVIIDPGIKLDYNYSVFLEGLEKNLYCKHADGAYAMGKVWPGDCYFPDFTNPEARSWWAGLYRELIEEIGVAGVWNDMNEPALFEVPSKTFLLNVLHNYEGQTTSHREIHNLYGMQMARATHHGVKQYNQGKRALIISRSGYSGLQRYSSVWTGDNIASWEHVWLADVQTQRLSISGISFCGSDIGGFIGQPDGELMVRWIALGIFHPFCRVHSSGDHGDQEPWVFGDEYTEIFRKFVEIRYQLLPYIYTTFYQYHRYGSPMLRPLVFFDQSDADNINRDREFLCGDHLLVCPVDTADTLETEVYLPMGNWYYYFNNEKHEGSQIITLETPLDEVPLFVKAGAIIPHYPIQQYVGEKTIEKIKLLVYFKYGSESSYLYEDDHQTYDYENNNLRFAKLHYHYNKDKVTITQAIIGSYGTSIKNYELILIGFPAQFKSASCDNVKLDICDGSLLIDANFKKIVIH